MIRLYGHYKGSFRTVTEGLQLAFEKLGVLEGVHMGEGVEYEDAVGGASAPIAVVTGDPMRSIQAHFHGSHKEVWLLLAPNSEGILPEIKKELLRPVQEHAGEKVPLLTGLLAPSRWAENVLQREFPDHEVIYCPHGVLPVFRVNRERRKLAREYWKRQGVRLLHVTSSRLSRKCTRELIKVWKRINQERSLGGTLDVLVNPQFLQEFVEYTAEMEALSEVQVVAGQNFELAAYAAGLSGYAFVVQPSRAEGFGLVPVEARASGVPVVATAITGHVDHLWPPQPGVVIVEHSSEGGPSDDYPGALAPIVTEQAIYEALNKALDNLDSLYEEALEAADEIASSWAWEKQVEPAVNRLKERLNV